jgi:hypothetical protein
MRYGLSLTRRWGRQQPPPSAQIDWTNPITRELRDLWLFNGPRAPRNLVTGVASTAGAGGGFPPVADSEYRGRRFTGAAGNYRLDNVVRALPAASDYSMWSIHRMSSAAALNTVADSDNVVGAGRKFNLHVAQGGGGNGPYFLAFNTAGTGFPAHTTVDSNAFVGQVVGHGGFLKGVTVGTVINGRVAATAVLAGNKNADFSTTRIGRFTAEGVGLYYNGDIYLVARWGRALVDAEWQELWAHPWCLFAPYSMSIAGRAVPLAPRVLSPLVSFESQIEVATAALVAPTTCGRAMTPGASITTAVPADPALVSSSSPGAGGVGSGPLAVPASCGRGMTPFGFTTIPSNDLVPPDPPAPEDPEPDPELFAWYGATLGHSFVDGEIILVPSVFITPYPLDGVSLIDYGATGGWVLGGIVDTSTLTAFVAAAAALHGADNVYNRFDYL